jgi:hypothetical protein
MTSEEGLDVLVGILVTVFELVIGDISRGKSVGQLESRLGGERTRNDTGRPG